MLLNTSITPYTGKTQIWAKDQPCYGTCTTSPPANVGGRDLSGLGQNVQDETLDLKGTLEWRWVWVPPMIAGTTTPDLNNFPQPPIFVLHSVSESAKATLMTGPAGPNSKLTGSGTVSLTIGPGIKVPGSSFGTVPGSATIGTPKLQCNIVQLTTGASGVPAILKSSPALHVSLHGQQTGSSGAGLLMLNTYTSAIQLGSPSPFRRPDKGGDPDSNNRFVYKSSFQTIGATGYLFLPGSAVLSGGLQANADCLQGHVQMDVTPPIPNELPHTLTSRAGGIDVHTAGPSPSSTFVYQGLPLKNSDFGNHIVTLRVKADNSTALTVAEQAHVQTFYPGYVQPGLYAWNHPMPPANTTGATYPLEPKTPNWYFYYYQLYHNIWQELNPRGPVDPTKPHFSPVPAGIAAGSPNQEYNLDLTTSQGNEPSETNPHSLTIDIGGIAYGGGVDLFQATVYRLDPDPDPLTARTYPRAAGWLMLKGVQRYVWDSAHELGHQNVFRRVPSIITEPAGLGVPAFNPGLLDEDLDHLDDNWERDHQLDPGDVDTTHNYNYDEHNHLRPGMGDLGDQEFLADIQALPVIFAHWDLWKQDWANGGCQYGKLPVGSSQTPQDPARYAVQFVPAIYQGGVPARDVQNTSLVENLQQLNQAVQAAYQREPGHPKNAATTILTGIKQLGNWP